MTEPKAVISGIDEAALCLIDIITGDLLRSADPIDAYLTHTYWRSVLEKAALAMTVKSASDLAALAEQGLRPVDIKARLEKVGVGLTPARIGQLVAMANGQNGASAAK